MEPTLPNGPLIWQSDKLPVTGLIGSTPLAPPDRRRRERWKAAVRSGMMTAHTRSKVERKAMVSLHD
jgi:hypothetical protein